MAFAHICSLRAQPQAAFATCPPPRTCHTSRGLSFLGLVASWQPLVTVATLATVQDEGPHQCSCCMGQPQLGRTTLCACDADLVLHENPSTAPTPHPENEDPVVSFDQSLALAGALENSSVVHLLMLAARSLGGKVKVELGASEVWVPDALLHRQAIAWLLGSAWWHLHPVVVVPWQCSCGAFCQHMLSLTRVLSGLLRSAFLHGRSPTKRKIERSEELRLWTGVLIFAWWCFVCRCVCVCVVGGGGGRGGLKIHRWKVFILCSPIAADFSKLSESVTRPGTAKHSSLASFMVWDLRPQKNSLKARTPVR